LTQKISKIFAKDSSLFPSPAFGEGQGRGRNFAIWIIDDNYGTV
jgi:hypothetical protein